MSRKRIITRNIFWNVAGMVVPTLAGFILAPYLLRHLGQTTYGLWILIGSLSGYFGLLDLGVRGSVGRNMALFRAKRDRNSVNEIFSTALTYLATVGFVVLLVTFLLPLIFFRIFDVPGEERGSVTLALLLTGIHLAFWLPFNVFDATLWSEQRFDLLNGVDTPITLLRLGLTYVVVGQGHGLVGLAAITLSLTLLTGIVKGALSFWVDPGLRLAWKHVTRSACTSLFGYSIWLFIYSLTRVLSPQVSLLIIGSRLAVSEVTPYSIAGRLISYANAIIAAVTGVLTPVATAFHAEGDQARQRMLFLKGGRYCTALALYFVLVFFFLGRPLITLWLGRELPPAPLLLAILAIGEALPMAQYITQGLVFGMGAHRLLALASLAEIVGSLLLAVLLVGPYGLLGVCVAFASLGTLSRGIVPAVYGCRLLKVGIGEYCRVAIVPATASALLAGLGLGLLTGWQTPDKWPLLVGYSAAFSLCYLLCFALLAAREEVGTLWLHWRGRFALGGAADSPGPRPAIWNNKGAK